MYTREEARRIDNNPELLHVGIVDGKLWMSEDAQEEIEKLTGRSIATDNPRHAIAFLRDECWRMQARDERLGEDEARLNFLAYCSLKGIEHAIETRLFGPDHVGSFQPEALISAFFYAPPQVSMALN